MITQLGPPNFGAGTYDHFGLGEYNVADFGAVGDWSTDDSAAWLACINRIKSQSTRYPNRFNNGAIITMPPGFRSVVQTGIVLDGVHNITIRGQGSQSAQVGCALRTDRTDGGPVISAVGCQGTRIENLDVLHNGPAGTAASAINASGTSNVANNNFLSLYRCQLAAASTAGTLIDLLRIHNNVGVKLDHVWFNGGRYGLQGREVVGDVLNAVAIETCNFGGQDLAAVHNLGIVTNISGGTVFEPLRSGAMGGILQDATIPLTVLNMDGFYMADATATGTWIIVNGKSINIDAGLIFGAAGPLGTGIQFNATTDTVEIRGNSFQSLALGVDKNAQTVTNVTIGPNGYTTVTAHHNFTAGGTIYIET